MYHEHIEYCKFHWRSSPVNAAKCLRHVLKYKTLIFVMYLTRLQPGISIKNWDILILQLMHFRPWKGKLQKTNTDVSYFYLRRAGQNNVRTDQISLSLHGGTQRSVQTVNYIFLSHFNIFSASESVFVSFSIITLRSLYFRRKASKQITNNQRDYQRRIKKRKQNLLATFFKKKC